MTTPNLQFIKINPADDTDLPGSVRDTVNTGTQVKTLDTGHTVETLKADLASQVTSPFDIDVIGFIGSLAEQIFGGLIRLGVDFVQSGLEAVGSAGQAIVDFGVSVFESIGSAIKHAERGVRAFLGLDVGPELPPPPPIANAIFTDFESLVMPVATKAKEANEQIAVIDGQIATLQAETATALDRSEAATAASEQIILDLNQAKIDLAAAAQNALDQALAGIAEAEGAATAAATVATALAAADARLTDAAADALTEAEAALIRAEKGVEDADKALVGLDLAKLDIDKAQNDAIGANTRLLNMVFPAQSLIPIYPDGNIPAWEQQCLFLEDGTARDGAARETVDVPPGVKSAIKFVATEQRTVNAVSHARVAADQNIEYKYSFWAKADTPFTKIFVELRDQNGDHAIQTNEPVRVDGAAANEPHGGGAPYVANNLTLPTEWRKYSGTITLKPGVRQVRIDKIYWSHSNGTPGTQYLADIQISPNMPSQFEVDRLQTEAIQANTEATKALTTATRMAFPDISLVPTVGADNKPAWAGTTTPSYTDLPPGMSTKLLTSGVTDANTGVYSRTGSGTFPGLTGTEAQFTGNVYDSKGDPVLVDMDLKVSFWAKVSTGTGGVSVRLKDTAGADAITHVKPIQLDSNGAFKGWTATVVATTNPQLGSQWLKYTFAVRPKINAGPLRILVSAYTEGDQGTPVVSVWGLHASIYFPGQEEVDIAQNEASRALQDVANLRGKVDTLEQQKNAIEATANNARDAATLALSQSIPRHMMSVSGDGVQTDDFIRIPQVTGSAWQVQVEALTTKSNWVGTILCRTAHGDGRSTMSRWRVPNVDGTRKYWTAGWSDESVIGVDLTYFVDPMVQIKRPITTDSAMRYALYNKTTAPTTATTLTTHTHTFTKAASEMSARFMVGWDAATNGDYYYMRIRRNGTYTMGFQERTKLGPTFPWENGYREMVLNITGVTVSPGDVYTFEVWSSAGSADQRGVRKSTVEMSWLETKSAT